DLVAKLIPSDLGMTLPRALEIVPELRALTQRDERYARLLRCSLALEGLARHASTHAAGVLIAPGRLTDHVPMYRSPKGDITTQFDMKSLERVGLLKMDFLGLRTLTVLDDATRLVAASAGEKVDLASIPLDDGPTYALLQRAQTIGIFQLESGGMRDLLRKVLPDTFEDIIAINALFRPGPIQSGMIDDFAKRKHGKQRVTYMHSSLEPILRKTYGVIVYQDQVMQIANRLAGFTLAQADLLRRAMGKKKPEEMASQKSAFLEGCATNRVSPKKAEEIFDLMEKFAGYGFVRSHSPAYAMLSYQSAWLKAHYPAAYLAASLSSEVGDTDRIVTLVEEARRLGLEVLPPDVNASTSGFTLEGSGIRFGLSAIKNVGQGSVEALVRAREAGGPIRTLGDLIRRVETAAVNRRVLESLIQAGACDRLEGDRAQLFAAVGDLLAQAQERARGHSQNQESLFGADEEIAIQELRLPAVETWPLDERLRREREVLGFYFSDHPLAAYKNRIETRATADTARLREARDGSEATLLVLVASVKPHTDRNKRAMAFVTLEDMKGTVEATVFADLFEKSRNALRPGTIVEVRGRVDIREDADPKMVLNSIQPVDAPAAGGSEGVYAIHIDLPETGSAVPLEEIRELLARHPGASPVYFHVREGDEPSSVRIRAKRLLVQPNAELIRALRDRLGDGAVRVLNGRPEAVPF
ncbi:MAG: DNA polymerase III subunit alpha, partial [bacterium]